MFPCKERPGTKKNRKNLAFWVFFLVGGAETQDMSKCKKVAFFEQLSLGRWGGEGSHTYPDQDLNEEYPARILPIQSAAVSESDMSHEDSA